MDKKARALDVGGGVCAGAIPVALALTRARGGDRGVDAACDEAVVRVVGRGYTGLLHGLDALMGAPLAGRSQWASVGCAAALGVLAYLVARRLLRGTARGALGVVLAVVAAALATLTFPAQRESMLVGGSVLGAALVLAPTALLAEGAAAGWIAAALGLAATYDLPVAIAAAASAVVVAAVSGKIPKWRAAPIALVGLVPVAWMAWRRAAAPDASLDFAPLAGLLGEGARAVPRGIALGIARAELGVVAIAAAAVGAVVALRSRVTRPIAAGLLTTIAVGAAASAVGAPAGPVRFGGALLAALAAAGVLAAAGMAAIVAAVSNARIPFARASASMIVLMALAVPVSVADDAALAAARLPRGATAQWNGRVFGDLPRDAVVLLSGRRMLLRARAATAAGALRSDVLVLSTGGMSAAATGRVIAREPLVAPVVRDLALYGAPEEFSLSQLAAARPVLVAFDPRWDRRLARHLLPEGAFDRYFVEPRGASERKKALPEATLDEATARALAADPPLRDATRDVLLARAFSAAATGEHDYAEAATVELRRVAPADPVGIALARRLASPHGAADLEELAARSGG